MELPNNLLIPFRRDKKRDFASGQREVLLVSKVQQALLTNGATERSPGELHWRTTFGSKFTLLRHKNNNEVLRETARVYARECFAKWLPTVELISVEIRQKDATMWIMLRVREQDVETTVELPLSS